jgi:hypothetical protein
MSRVFYLVAATETQGIFDAAERGWTRIASTRFVTAEKDDVRVVCKMTDLHPIAGGTEMFKGSDYDDGPSNDFLRRRWLGDGDVRGEKDRFDAFVAEGNGQWLD